MALAHYPNLGGSLEIIDRLYVNTFSLSSFFRALLFLEYSMWLNLLLFTVETAVSARLLLRSMVPLLLVEFPASPVHHQQHLPPRFGALAPDSDDILLDRDVRPTYLPPCLAIRSHIFRERYALSPHNMPRSLMNLSSSSTCFESALKGGVTLNERIRRRLLQSTMKCSLRKSILASLLPRVPYRQPSHVPPDREASAVNGADSSLRLASFFP